MWKKIQNFENYEISSDGMVRTLLKKGGFKYLKPWVNSKKPGDYLRVSIFKNGKQFKFLLHRLVAIHFVDNFYRKPQVNHKDGDRQNNCFKNLEWVTNSENQIHSFKITGTHKHNNLMSGKFGKDHNCSKPFFIEFFDGRIESFGSAYEFVRSYGFGRTSISWARRKKYSGYKFGKGKMKGLTVHFELVP